MINNNERTRRVRGNRYEKIYSAENRVKLLVLINTHTHTHTHTHTRNKLILHEFC
jgi:hypothetical protein